MEIDTDQNSFGHEYVFMSFGWFFTFFPFLFYLFIFSV